MRTDFKPQKENTRIHKDTYTRTCTHAHKHTQTHTHTHNRARTNTLTRARIHSSMRTRTKRCKYARVDASCAHTHTHTHTHIHARARSCTYSVIHFLSQSHTHSLTDYQIGLKLTLLRVCLRTSHKGKSFCIWGLHKVERTVNDGFTPASPCGLLRNRKREGERERERERERELSDVYVCSLFPGPTNTKL